MQYTRQRGVDYSQDSKHHYTSHNETSPRYLFIPISRSRTFFKPVLLRGGYNARVSDNKSARRSSQVKLTMPRARTCGGIGVVCVGM